MVIPEARAGVIVNPAVLKAARYRVGLSREGVAERASERILRHQADARLTARDVAALEQGERLPTVLEAEALATVCLVGYLDLFSESLPPPPLRDFRKPVGSSSRLSYEAHKRIDLFDRLYEVARRVTSRLSHGEPVGLPAAGPGPLETSDIVSLAAATRAALGIGAEEQSNWEGEKEALAAWTNAVERLGVSVFRISMPIDEIRGMSRWESGGPQVVVLNSSDSPMGQVFTLHHEIGHLVLSTGSGSLCDPQAPARHDEERKTNAFASEVLVPAATLRAAIPAMALPPSYRDWPRGVRRDLQRRFCVSGAVVGIRLEGLGLVNDSGYRPFWRTRTGQARGGGLATHERYRTLFGDQATRLVKQALRDESIRIPEIARILGLKASHVELFSD